MFTFWSADSTFRIVIMLVGGEAGVQDVEVRMVEWRVTECGAHNEVPRIRTRRERTGDGGLTEVRNSIRVLIKMFYDGQ